MIISCLNISLDLLRSCASRASAELPLPSHLLIRVSTYIICFSPFFLFAHSTLDISDAMYWTKFFIAIGLLAASVPALPTASSAAAPQASPGNTSSSTDSAVCKNDCCVPLQEIDPLKDLAYQNPNPKLSAAAVTSATTTSKITQPSNPVTRRESNYIDVATIEAISRRGISKPRQVGEKSLFDPRGSGTSRTFTPWESSLSSLTVFSQQECAELEQLSQGTNFKHLMDTLWAIRNALAPYGVRWAVAGGLALKIHGMQRFTTDVDIVVQTDITTLRGILLRNPAFITPGTWWPWHGVHIKAYFKYAANRGGSMPQFVEIDFIIAGMYPDID